MSLNKRMGDKHEEDVAALLDGRVSRGSGNQWHNPMDGRTSEYAWDCKSTLKQSMSISREMWEKARQQAGAHTPLLPVRFYDNEALDVGLDLALINIHDLAALIERAARVSD